MGRMAKRIAFKNMEVNAYSMPGGKEARRAVIRQCKAEQMGFYQCLVLVLKGEWNHARSGNGSKSETDDQGGCAVPQLPFSAFSLDTNRLFADFEAEGAGWVSESGYDVESFGLLVQEMIASEILRYDYTSPEVSGFIERAMKEKIKILGDAPPELSQEFKEAKARWLLLQNDLEERLLALERIRLRNANVNFRWFEIFGEHYVPLAEQQIRLDVLQRKLLLLDQSPDLSGVELEEKFRETEIINEKYLNKMKLEAALAARGQIQPSNDFSLDLENEMQYRQKSKQILREIYMLIHPDVLENDPKFVKLTDAQKESLRNLWHEVMEIRLEEGGFSERCMMHYYRSIALLENILDMARVTLEHAGIDTDLRHIIQGDTISDQIRWLEETIYSLENSIMNVLAEQKTLLEDETAREREAMLRWPLSKQNELIAVYQKQARDCEEEAMALDNELNRRLAT